MPVAPWPPGNPQQLGTTFSRLGWIGFFIQPVLLSVPLLLALYMLFGFAADSSARRGIDLSDYLSWGSLIVTIFTAIWFFRYPRLGRRIADGDPKLSGAAVLKTVWIGIWAGAIGIVFSMLMLFAESSRILFVMLANPQTGLMVSPNIGVDSNLALSALDGISLLTLLILLTAELLVLGLSMGLLYSAATPASDKAA